MTKYAKLLWLLPVAGAIVAAVLWQTPPQTPSLTVSGVSVAAPAGKAPVDLCLAPRQTDSFSQEGVQQSIEDRIAACRLAIAHRPDDLAIKVALAKALTTKNRPETVALLREAATQGDPEAYFQLYEQHRSWDRDLDRPALVTRLEADQSLRRAAELGHREAAYRLAIALDRGHILKRDPVQALLWAARVSENLPPGVRRVDVLVFLGRLLVSSNDESERARGRELLEHIAATGGTFNAKTVLANAIRADDPARARNLLESNLRSDPGGATVALADMLIKGEGGPTDAKRATQLLLKPTDTPSIHGALGQLYLEGKLVPRDIDKAINLIRHAAVWDYDAKLQLEQLLATHPDISVERSDVIIYEALEIADLDEPGALQAMIDLRFSQNRQFRDVADGCRWIGVARERGIAISAEQGLCKDDKL